MICITACVIIIVLIIGIAPNLSFHSEDYDIYQIGPDPHPDDWQDFCPHPETYLKVLEEIVNCETTVTACRQCGKHLNKPETDCA